MAYIGDNMMAMKKDRYGRLYFFLEVFSFIRLFKNTKNRSKGIKFVNIIVQVACSRFSNEKRKWLEVLKNVTESRKKHFNVLKRNKMIRFT